MSWHPILFFYQIADGAVSMNVIYDFGANNGDDIPYYLKKADVVVAIEANPSLAEAIGSRFADEVSDGRLVVENCALVVHDSTVPVPFYVHKENHVLSQFPPPKKEEEEQFDKILVPGRKPSDIVNQYGSPYYIKVDLEHFDQQVLEELFSANIHPTYISAECHDVAVFATLVSRGGYNAFKLVDGPSVSQCYQGLKIKTSTGLTEHSFPHHAAGPFGDDIPGDWMSANKFYHLLSLAGLGWKDVHAFSGAPAAGDDLSALPPKSERTTPIQMPLSILLHLLPNSLWRAFRSFLRG
jgi:FkbM family methyltransferase